MENENVLNENKTTVEVSDSKKVQEIFRLIDVFYDDTVVHFFPKMNKWIKKLRDPRNPNKIKYEIGHLIWIGILLFLCKLMARRQINFNFNTDEFRQNLNLISGTVADKVAHHDTLEYLLERLNSYELEKLNIEMIYRLLRMKYFMNSRLLGEYYIVAIDGTGHLTFKDKHCENCLVRDMGETQIYYHQVLEAKLVGPLGQVFSVGTEFIDNEEDKGLNKQDCETNAFKRLAKKLKRKFPQLRICLVLDGLYAVLPVIDICEENKWKYIITLKEGRMPEGYQEFEKIKELSPKNCGQHNDDKIKRKYKWADNFLQYKSNYVVNGLECKEITEKTKKRFVWITNIAIDKRNYQEIASGGRLRWKIENEGFNIQKNGGYDLEHKFSGNNTALKNFYFLLQIAHTISQLMEKGKKVIKLVKKIFGSIRNIAIRLLEGLRNSAISINNIENISVDDGNVDFYEKEPVIFDST